MHNAVRTLAAILLLTGAAWSQLQATTQSPAVRIPWKVVGNPGNPADVFSVGKVDYPYLIGRFEVTNAQYALFLSSKAALGDPLELYNPEMTSHGAGGIQRTGSGVPGAPYRYAAKPDMAAKPVNFVSFFDALRFANWVHNGFGTGDTESGSYLLLGGTPIPLNGDNVARGFGARVVLPTENEWYKAAYYDPTAFPSYWLFATRSNQIPTIATATPTGSIANPGVNVVNYFGGVSWGGELANVTTVGSAGPGSESFYGCADMNGNVAEWSETTQLHSGSVYRIARGGDFIFDESIMQKTNWGIVLPFVEKETIGMRLVLLLD